MNLRASQERHRSKNRKANVLDRRDRLSHRRVGYHTLAKNELNRCFRSKSLWPGKRKFNVFRRFSIDSLLNIGYISAAPQGDV
jgi:hypothetical protein